MCSGEGLHSLTGVFDEKEAPVALFLDRGCSFIFENQVCTRCALFVISFESKHSRLIFLPPLVCI